jgi:hypothetical protein
MSIELLGEWLTYASFAVPGMLWFADAVWAEWHDPPRAGITPGGTTVLEAPTAS